MTQTMEVCLILCRQLVEDGISTDEAISRISEQNGLFSDETEMLMELLESDD